MIEKAVTTTPFGKFVKKCLVDLEWTLEDLAKHAEISRTQLSRVFSGKSTLTHDMGVTLLNTVLPDASRVEERNEGKRLIWESVPFVVFDLLGSSNEIRELAYKLSELLEDMEPRTLEGIRQLLELTENEVR